MKKIIAKLNQIKKGMLDDDYTLFDNGEILHEYDTSIYAGGQNRSRNLKASDLNTDVRNRLLSEANEDNKELAKKLLGLE